jgi:pyruvate dehydrogenase E2 component (dihydrolipoamide acetyltransferase)
MTDIVMPRLSDSMEEGTILKWLKASGAEVSRGEEIVEIETDKANMTYESDADGALEIVAQEGATLPIGELIARVGGGGGEAAPAEAAPAEGAPVAAAEAPAPEPAAAPAKPATPAAANADGERVKASPVARRLARERGVELSSITGSGPGGRIVKADVETAGTAPAAAASPAPSAPPSPGGSGKGETQVEELSKLQQVIARRMAESKATVPEFTLTSEIDMEACVALRSELKALAREPVPSYNDMVVKACALALREYPRANGAYKDGRFELYSRVNVGVAVAAQDALVVPTVFDADVKALGHIATDARTLAERVRSGAITPPELSGGTFTVSNLGMFGVTDFVAVVNPPQAAILAVGAAKQEAVVTDGRLEAATVLRVTLSVDHRPVDGAVAARWMSTFVGLLERPVRILS